MTGHQPTKKRRNLLRQELHGRAQRFASLDKLDRELTVHDAPEQPRVSLDQARDRVSLGCGERGEFHRRGVVAAAAALDLGTA